MGSHASEEGRDTIETQHVVILTKPYYMGKYEVTQEQWERVMGNNPSYFKGAKLPVTDVSWEDCQRFIKKLNENTKGVFRLPTDAEWEYACRAGTTTAYSFGDKITPKDANLDDYVEKVPEVSLQTVLPVGSYKPNAFGIYDMHGNVWELCQDVGRFDIWPSSFRGGSSSFSRKLVPESGRNEAIYYRDSYSGFRLARTP